MEKTAEKLRARLVEGEIREGRRVPGNNLRGVEVEATHKPIPEGIAKLLKKIRLGRVLAFFQKRQPVMELVVRVPLVHEGTDNRENSHLDGREFKNLTGSGKLSKLVTDHVADLQESPLQKTSRINLVLRDWMDGKHLRGYKVHITKGRK